MCSRRSSAIAASRPGWIRPWESLCSRLRMYAVKCARVSQRETMTSSPGSRSDCQTWRSTKPSKPSTRPTRSRNAATSSGARSGAIRSRESETYTPPNLSADQLSQARVQARRVRAPQPHLEGAAVADDDRELLRAGQPGVEQVAGQHHRVRGRQDHHDRAVLRALGAVDRQAVAELERVAGAVGDTQDAAVVAVQRHALLLVVARDDDAGLPVHELVLVVVAALDEAVADAERQAGDRRAVGVQAPPKLGVEGLDPERALVHRREDEDLARGV